MREKYESLPLVQLKELAKVRGLKGTSTMKKAELVEAMLAEDERLKKEEEAKAAEQKQESATETVRSEEPQKQERSERPVRQERNYRPDRNYRGESAENVGVRSEAYTKERTFNPNNVAYDESQYPKELDSGIEASGILEVMPDGYGFIRCENYMPGENDVYVAPSQIRRFGLKTGDILKGNKRIKTQQEKFSALLFVKSINGYTVEESSKRMAFEDMTPIFPDERIKMETPGCSIAMRVMDLVSPVGKGHPAGEVQCAFVC
jgi:transcription termination factor Rho